MLFSNATLKGWSSSKAFDPTKDTLFALNGEYGIDTNEPVTLYAVWELSVEFDLNKQLEECKGIEKIEARNDTGKVRKIFYN